MSQDSAYGSQSLEYAIDTNDWYQIASESLNNPQAYRIRCTATGYIQAMPQLALNTKPTNPAPVAPAVGAPVKNTKGMTTGQVEVFTLPDMCWLRASAGATFEASSGEGV